MRSVVIASRVCDASVLVSFLARDPRFEEQARHELSSGIVAAPSIVDLEVIHGLRGRWLGGKLDDHQLEGAVRTLGRSPIVRYPVQRLGPRIVELRHNLSAYDASYVALAESLGTELVTIDRRMATAPGVRCPVRLL